MTADLKNQLRAFRGLPSKSDVQEEELRRGVLAQRNRHAVLTWSYLSGARELTAPGVEMALYEALSATQLYEAKAWNLDPKAEPWMTTDLMGGLGFNPSALLAHEVTSLPRLLDAVDSQHTWWSCDEDIQLTAVEAPGWAEDWAGRYGLSYQSPPSTSPTKVTLTYRGLDPSTLGFLPLQFN